MRLNRQTRPTSYPSLGNDSKAASVNQRNLLFRMLYSPERNGLEGTASTGSVLASGNNIGAGVYSGRRLTLNGVKDAGRRRMGRSKKVVLASLRLCASQALPAVLLGIAVVGNAAYAQSAKSWAKKGQDAEAHQDWDAAYEDYHQATLKNPKDLRYKTHFETVRFQA